MRLSKKIPKTMYSPLIGGAMASMVFCIYWFFCTPGNILEIAVALFRIFPFLSTVFIIISYFLSLTAGQLIIHLKKAHSLSGHQFMMLSWMLSACIGLLVAGMNYHWEHLIGKSLTIFFAISLGGLFNASLYHVIEEMEKNTAKD